MTEKVMKYVNNKDTIMMSMTSFYFNDFSGIFDNLGHILHHFSSFTVDFEQLVSC